MDVDRYHRQTLLPQIGREGQARLRAARVLVVGCGALGTVIAEQLVRAGVGMLRLVDRDVVEWTNLQRQVLFTEADVERGMPKAIAAAERLAAINRDVVIDARPIDVDAGNIETLLEGGIDLILDGTDNVETRYLINDVAVKHGVPWVYGAAVGVEGRVMGIRPGDTACLRCVFRDPPRASDLATCDTAGVLAPVTATVASLQVIEGIKILLGGRPTKLVAFDGWEMSFRAISLATAKDPECPCCGRRDFTFLAQGPRGGSVTLCGRNAVQVRGSGPVDLAVVAERVRRVAARVDVTRFMVRADVLDAGVTLTVFPDGRAIVGGTNDLSRARAVVARYLGS